MDHDYKPGPWTPQDEARAAKYGRWDDVPNDLRYSACVCGLSWRKHAPW